MELDSQPLHSALKAFAKKIDLSSHNESVLEAIVDYFLSNYPKTATLQDEDGRLPLHLALALRYPWSIAAMILQRHSVACEVSDALGGYPLHYAADYLAQETTAIESLLQAHPSACQACDEVDGSLPLHRALSAKAADQVIALLLDAYPEACSIQDQQGCLPLHRAAMNPATSITILQRLIKALPDACAVRNAQECLPLHLACSHDTDPAVLMELVNAYPRACQLCDEHGQYPLHLAAVKAKSLEVMVRLIASYPAACRIRDRYDKLPIHYLSYQINHEVSGVRVIERMLRCCPEIVHAPYNHMSTLYRYKYYYNRSISVHRMMLNACPAMLEEADDRRSYREFNWKARRALVMLVLGLRRARGDKLGPRVDGCFLMQLARRIDLDEHFMIYDCFGSDLLRWLISYL